MTRLYGELEAALARAEHGADVIVDLSNVMRAQALDDPGSRCAHGGACARLSRLARLLDAWQNDIEREPAFLGVADSSLHGLLCTREEKEVFAGWKRRGLILEVGYADPEILAAAERNDAAVLSGDGFKNFRRLSAWVADNHGRFVRWTVSPAGLVLEHGLPPVPLQDLSRAEENDELREHGLRTAEAEPVLGQHWRCPSSSCFAQRMYPDRLGVLPRFMRGVARCPWCAGPLIPAGKRSATVEVKVERHGTDYRTLLLEDGTDVFVGRDAPPVFDLTAGLPTEVGSRISRRHALLRFSGGLLHVQDAGSANGTRLLKWNPQLRRLEDSGAVRREAWTHLGRADAVILADVVTLRVSGRRWPLGGPTLAWSKNKPIDGVTRLGD